jgi:hypothetical protein
VLDQRGRLLRAVLRFVALHPAPWASRIGHAAASTLVAAVFFCVLGDVTKFPHGMIGFSLFLVGVFALGVGLYGQID